MGSQQNSTNAEGVTLDGGDDGPRRALMVYHRDGLQVVPLVDGEPVVIGRTEPSDIRLRSRRLSRQHARFSLGDDGQVWVEDLGSTNGTEVNGAPIEARVAIASGDEVCLCSVTVTVHALQPGWLRPLGLEGHDQFLGRVEAEIQRARTFDRGLAVVMARSLDVGTQLGSWVPALHQRLRMVDRVALFAPDCVEILLPEASRDEALAVGRDLLESVEEPLGLGVALWPQAGASIEELVDAARAAVLKATVADPIQVPTTPFEPLPAPSDDGGPIVRDPVMEQLYRTVDRVARSVISVLVVGETGTGKEVVARAIHDRSDRSDLPMRVINCGAIPSSLTESILFGHERGAFTGADQRRTGVFEEADGGTVLLDEIGELPAAAQVALLRVLETRRIQRVGSSQEIGVDVRVVAATHRDLEAMCEEGTFRWDLLYRLNPLSLALPPLRKRLGEIRPLVARFMVESNRVNNRSVRGIAPESLRLLEAYDWPGNVRELRNTIDRAVVIAVGDVVLAEDLPERIRGDMTTTMGWAHTGSSTPELAVRAEEFTRRLDHLDLKAQVGAHERQLIHGALCATGFNQSRAAELLQIPRRTLVYKLKAHNIERTDPPAAPPADVRDAHGRPVSFRERIAGFERALVHEALGRSLGDLGGAARLLNVQRRTLLQKMARLGLSP